MRRTRSHRHTNRQINGFICSGIFCMHDTNNGHSMSKKAIIDDLPCVATINSSVFSGARRRLWSSSIYFFIGIFSRLFWISITRRIPWNTHTHARTARRSTLTSMITAAAPTKWNDIEPSKSPHTHAHTGSSSCTQIFVWRIHIQQSKWSRLIWSSGHLYASIRPECLFVCMWWVLSVGVWA